MAERRYDEAEIREILSRATELRPEEEIAPPGGRLERTGSGSDSGEGLSLAELKDVGAEAGIPPARVAEAVAEVELNRSLEAVEESHLGVVLDMDRNVRLPRLLTEDEWDRFVVRLRDTFDTAGEVRSEGSLRTWSGPHLKVLLEPVQAGARLRFQSRDGGSKSLVDGGTALVASGGLMGALLAVLAPMAGKPVPPFLVGVVLAVLGVGGGLWAVGRYSARQVRQERARQFRALGADALRLAGAGEGGMPGGPDPDRSPPSA